MENLFEMNFTPVQVNAISNLGLAHMGDGVYELLCRTYLCAKGDQTVLKLHKDTVALVKAPTQAKFADVLKPVLTEEEFAYFRRGKMPTPMLPPSLQPRRSMQRPPVWKPCSGRCIYWVARNA